MVLCPFVLKMPCCEACDRNGSLRSTIVGMSRQVPSPCTFTMRAKVDIEGLVEIQTKHTLPPGSFHVL